MFKIIKKTVKPDSDIDSQDSDELSPKDPENQSHEEEHDEEEKDCDCDSDYELELDIEKRKIIENKMIDMIKVWNDIHNKQPSKVFS